MALKALQRIVVQKGLRLIKADFVGTILETSKAARTRRERPCPVMLPPATESARLRTWCAVY